MHVLDNIKRNIDNLRFAVEFDTFDLTYTQQAMILHKIEEIQKCIEEIESESTK